MNYRLLVLDAGSVASNNLIRGLRKCLASSAIIGCAADRFTLQRSLADRNYLVASSGREFLRSLRRVIKAERTQLVIPNSDRDVKALSDIRDRLPCRTFLPRTSVLERCSDKLELVRFLRKKGVSVPATYAIEHVDQIESLFRRLSALSYHSYHSDHSYHSQLWCRIRKGSGAVGAIPVMCPAHARSWIEYWQDVRSVPPGMFTLAEYLPGRDIAVQCIFRKGRLYICKMLQRLSYNIVGGSPSGISSTAALSKMIYERRIESLCVRAITALDPAAEGAFALDLRDNEEGRPCITEINAGRFSNSAAIHDLLGEPSTVLTYVRLALGERVAVTRGRAYDDDHYILRHVDMPPSVLRASELSEGIRNARRPLRRA